MEIVKNSNMKNSKPDRKAFVTIVRYLSFENTPQDSGQVLFPLWSEDVFFPFMFLDLLVRLLRKPVLKSDLQPCVLLIVVGRDGKINENFVCPVVIILNYV